MVEARCEEAKGTKIISQLTTEHGPDGDIVKTTIVTQNSTEAYILYTTLEGKHVKTEGTLELQINYKSIWEVIRPH